MNHHQIISVSLLPVFVGQAFGPAAGLPPGATQSQSLKLFFLGLRYCRISQLATPPPGASRGPAQPFCYRPIKPPVAPMANRSTKPRTTSRLCVVKVVSMGGSRSRKQRPLFRRGNQTGDRLSEIRHGAPHFIKIKRNFPTTEPNTRSPRPRAIPPHKPAAHPSESAPNA